MATREDDYGDQYSQFVPDEGGQVAPAQRPATSSILNLWGLFGRRTATFKRQQGDPEANGGINEMIKEATALPLGRPKMYELYNQMYQHPTISGYVDAMAEEATPHDEKTNRVVTAKSVNPEVLAEVSACLETMGVEDSVEQDVRSVFTYGDHYKRLYTTSSHGVTGTHRLVPLNVDRVEDQHSRLVGFRVANAEFGREVGKNKNLSFPWDVIHWRMPPRYDFQSTVNDKYGVSGSGIYGMQRGYRCLVLSEDRVLRQRLGRTGGRRLWRIPVPSDLSEGEQADFVTRMKDRFRQAVNINAGTAMYTKFNPISDLEDIYWPVPDGAQGPQVELLPEGNFEASLADVEYFRNLIYSAGKINKAYFGLDDAGYDPTKTLSQQDLRVARLARKIRKVYLIGLKTAVDIHLTLRYSQAGASLTPEQACALYRFHVPKMGALEELERLEVYKMQMDVADALFNLGASLNLNPTAWAAHLLVNYLDIPEKRAISLLAQPTPGTVPPSPEELAMAQSGDPGQPPPPAEDLLRSGLHPLNEAEQGVLRKLRANPAISTRLAQLARVLHEADEAEDYTDPSMTYPTGLLLEEYVKHETTDDPVYGFDIRAAITENRKRAN